MKKFWALAIILLLTAGTINAAEKDVELSKHHLKKGVSFIKNEELEKAIDEFKKAIELNPTNSAPYYNLGLCCLRLGRFREAINPLETYVKFHPNRAFAYYNLGYVYAKIGEEDKSLAAYNKALQLNPDLANRSNR